MIHHLVPSDRRRSDDRSEGNFGEEKSGPTHSKVGRQKAPRSHDRTLFKSVREAVEGQNFKGDENSLILDELKETGQANVDSL